MGKWDNMLAILWFLKSRKRMTAEQLADNLEISVRTVYRYIDALCASGVPIIAEAGRNGGYRLLESFREAPLFFNPPELKAIAHSALFARGAGYPFTAELSTALDKIESRLNGEQMDYLQRHMSGLEVISTSQGPSMTTLLQQLEQAVADCETLRMEYRKEGADNADERNIDPYGLAFHRNSWYLIAFCHRRKEIRMFRVDRIVGLSTVGAFFTKPSGFSIQGFFRKESDRKRETEEPFVLLRIQGEAEELDAICRHWHLRHYLKERFDREVQFAIDAPTLEKYIPMYLMTFGTRIRVLEPERIRKLMAETARNLAVFYETELH